MAFWWQCPCSRTVRGSAGRVLRRVARQEFAQDERLPAKPLRARIVREEIAELVSKHRRAAWLEHDHRAARVDLLAETIHDAPQVGFGPRQHAEVVERAAAAEVSWGTLTLNPAASNTSYAATAVSGWK